MRACQTCNFALFQADDGVDATLFDPECSKWHYIFTKVLNLFELKLELTFIIWTQMPHVHHSQNLISPKSASNAHKCLKSPNQGYVSSLRSARALPNDYWTAETVEDYMRCKVKNSHTFSFLYHIPFFQVINFPIGVQNPMARKGAFKTWILSRSVEEKVSFGQF